MSDLRVAGVGSPDPGSPLQHPAWLRYGFAVLSTVAVTCVARELDPLWDSLARHPYLVEWPIVIGAAYFGGLGPGLLAAVLSTLAILSFWIEPRGVLWAKNPTEYVALGLYSLSAVAVVCLIQRLHQSRAEERRQRRSREIVLGVVAHDLRNPLATISMASAILRRKPNDLERLNTIDRATRRMDRLIRDLLDSSALEGGLPLKTTFADEDVEPLVAEAVATAMTPATSKEIDLVTDVRPGLRARCDRGRLLQALGNLLDNAIKFTPEGGRVTVRAIDADPFVRLEVADTGPGIPAQHQPSLFDRHWTGGRPGSGSGLGLFIVRGIVRAHRGRIWLHAEEGRGTTFFFTIPAAPFDEAPCARPQEERHRDPHAS